MRARRGIISLAVLWILLAALPAATASREASYAGVLATRNRSELIVAEFQAEGCFARLRAAADRALRLNHEERTTSPEQRDRFVRAIITHPLMVDCESKVQVIPGDEIISVNAASDVALAGAFARLGAGVIVAESLAAAVLDWRDADDRPRPLGAERDWYTASGRRPPRNGPLEHTRELWLVRGVEEALGPSDGDAAALLERLLSVDQRSTVSADGRESSAADLDFAPQVEAGLPREWFVRVEAGIPPVAVVLRARLGRSDGGFIARDVWVEP